MIYPGGCITDIGAPTRRVTAGDLTDEYAMGWEAAARNERERIARKLRGILACNVVWPQATADAIYGLLNELDSS